MNFVNRIGDHGHILVANEPLVPRTAAQEIEGGVMDDAKQPTLDVADRRRPWKSLDGLQQRLLHDVLAVDAGAHHARAIAMQFWPQASKHTVERFLIDRLRRRHALSGNAIHKAPTQTSASIR